MNRRAILRTVHARRGSVQRVVDRCASGRCSDRHVHRTRERAARRIERQRSHVSTRRAVDRKSRLSDTARLPGSENTSAHHGALRQMNSLRVSSRCGTWRSSVKSVVNRRARGRTGKRYVRAGAEGPAIRGN